MCTSMDCRNIIDCKKSNNKAIHWLVFCLNLHARNYHYESKDIQSECLMIELEDF